MASDTWPVTSIRRDSYLHSSGVTVVVFVASHVGARVQVILSNHRSDISDSTKEAGMIWVSIHRGLKWLKACSTFSYHIERHQAKMITTMPEAHKHKSEPYVTLCIKAFSNFVLFPTYIVKPWYKKPRKTITPGKRTTSFAPVTRNLWSSTPMYKGTPLLRTRFPSLLSG